MENMIDSYLIAKLELAEKRVPFIIRRPIANGSSEYWNVKDLEILVEGHTDSIPLSGRGLIKDNWDLSVMRATSVVKRLTSNSNLDPTQLIAAGRSEFVPIMSNSSSEGRNKNRRIEMILSPNLDDLFKLLDE